MEPGEYVTLSRLEDTYWWYVGLRQLVLSAIQRYSRLTPASKILDLGCGTGGTLSFLRQRLNGIELCGVDPSPLALSMTRGRFKEGLAQASANELPFPGEIFDAVISLDVFYIQGVNDRLAFSESRRVLKRGGLMVINLPAFEFLRGEHDLAVHTRHRYTAGEVRERLREAGFMIRRLSYWNAFLFPFVFAARRWSRHPPVSVPPKSDLKQLPDFLNKVLKSVLLLERKALSFVDLPFGSSVFAVAEKR